MLQILRQAPRVLYRYITVPPAYKRPRSRFTVGQRFIEENWSVSAAFRALVRNAQRWGNESYPSPLLLKRANFSDFRPCRVQPLKNTRLRRTELFPLAFQFLFRARDIILSQKQLSFCLHACKHMPYPILIWIVINRVVDFSFHWLRNKMRYKKSVIFWCFFTIFLLEYFFFTRKF